MHQSTQNHVRKKTLYLIFLVETFLKKSNPEEQVFSQRDCTVHYLFSLPVCLLGRVRLLPTVHSSIHVKQAVLYARALNTRETGDRQPTDHAQISFYSKRSMVMVIYYFVLLFFVETLIWTQTPIHQQYSCQVMNVNWTTMACLIRD